MSTFTGALKETMDEIAMEELAMTYAIDGSEGRWIDTDTPFQYTRSIQSLNSPFQHNLSTTISTLHVTTPSTHPFNTLAQHNLSMHPINIHYQHLLPTKPHNSLALPIFNTPMHL